MTVVPFTRSQVLQRYRTVLRVMSHYGFGFIAEAVGIARLRFWRKGAREADDHAAGRGERLRRAFEELGPTFVKLGQMLSTRSDLLPADLTVSPERLQDQVTPVPFEQVEALLVEELGAPLLDRFAEIDPVPIAAASLGQVHRAVLADGREVVLKVQRPGVREQVELDLHVLRSLAAAAARRTQVARQYDLPGAVREFAGMILAELDYTQEGQNADRFRQNFANDAEIYFPVVHWEHSSGRVLTLERVRGMRVTDRRALQHARLEPSDVAQRLAGAIFRMVLRDGFFHADPHPGNLFVGSEGTIIFVDHGMVGQLTPAMRDNVVDYVIGVVSHDSDLVVDAIMRMGLIENGRHISGLRREVERLQRKYGEIPLKQVQFGPALREMLAAVRQFEIRFPSNYAVLLKALSTLEAVARQIDPEATMIGLAAPYAELVLVGRYKPSKLLGRAGRELLEAGRHAVRIPRQVSRVLSLMEEGDWKLAIDHTGLDPALRRLSAIANRLAISILLASLVIGTALVSSSSKQSFLQHYPIADVGFLLIGAVGLWLILSILGSKS